MLSVDYIIVLSTTGSEVIIKNHELVLFISEEAIRSGCPLFHRSKALP